MFDFIIGAGQGGCRLGKVFSEAFDTKACYINFTRVDFGKFDAKSGEALIIETGGTGRDPKVGEKLAVEYKELLVSFLEEQYIPYMASRVLLCVGGGGGSGAGMMFVIIDFLLKRGAKVLLLYTMPEKDEGLPAKPNSLRSLNKLIGKYLETNKITVMAVDNEFCAQTFNPQKKRHNGKYWNGINIGIVRSLLRFHYMVKSMEFFDVTSGYGALDQKELERILYTKGGFIDIREVNVDNVNIKEFNFHSSIFGDLDMATAKSYIVVVGFPTKLQGSSTVNDFLEELFTSLKNKTKTPFLIRASYFHKKLKHIRIDVLLAGLSRSKGLKRAVKSAVKDVNRYKKKGGAEELDLDGVDF